MNITTQNLSANKPVKLSPAKRPQQDSTNFRQDVKKQASFNLVDVNHNRLLVKKSKVSFSGKGALNLPKNLELEKRVSSALEVLGRDDIILVGQNLKESRASLLGSISAAKNVIKKVFFIQDDKMKGALALRKGDKGLPEVINLNEDLLTVRSQGPEGDIPVQKGSEAYLAEGDEVVTSNFRFAVQDLPMVQLGDLRRTTVKEFDFSETVKKNIERLNKASINQILPGQGTGKAKRITFKDVGGQDKAIKELKRAVVFPLKYPQAYKHSDVSHGVILTGGPGTGKTLLAHALANETNAHFIKLNGLEMESQWTGVAEENWRRLFDDAKGNQPCIIFIDEFDAVARKRTGSEVSRHDDKIVDQLLTVMDDLEKEGHNVVVVAATNRIDVLDDAIIRSGRFGKHIAVEKPDSAEACKNILDIHTRNKPVSDKFDKDEFAKKMFAIKTSGADIAHLANEANTNAMERTGIFAKMEDGTFVESDIDNMKIEPQDFDKAFEDFKAQQKLTKKDEEKKLMGFGR